MLKQEKGYGCGLYAVANVLDLKDFITPQRLEKSKKGVGSVRSWIHYLQIRCDSHTQLEHQQIGLAILDIFKTNFPNISKALEL